MAVVLFEDKRDCCGCGACANVCSRNAIQMEEDEYGFVYPQIDAVRCVECGLCRTVCGYQDPPAKARPGACYAAAAKDEARIRKSASGGIFAVLAADVLKNNGAVYGAAMLLEEEGFSPKHIRIENSEDLTLLQGSKYVQSDTGETYFLAKKDLLNGKSVLYSGTPCQIAGLLKFLGKKYENLLTMEVICHGVPSAKMFRDFVAELERKQQKSVSDFAFRTKAKGQGKHAYVAYRDGNGKVLHTFKNSHTYSYLHYFAKAQICRTNCYSCPFAGEQRVADITVGDFWGFHQEHPKANPFRDKNGISCVLVNSERGCQAIMNCKEALTLLSTDFEKIARHNEQLQRPCRNSREREVLMELYRNNGYGAVDARFRKTCGKDRAVQTLIGWVPQGIKRNFKRMMGRVK